MEDQLSSASQIGTDQMYGPSSEVQNDSYCHIRTDQIATEDMYGPSPDADQHQRRPESTDASRSPSRTLPPEGNVAD